jgi:mannose-6-phosphate isomerase-like protein (cupin superfamily)
MKQTLLILVLGALPLAAAPPPGFVHWKAAELKGLSTKLAPKLDAGKTATEQLGNYGNHFFMAAYREASGQAELHEGWADIFVVESGAGRLVVGGEMVDARTTAPGELRGPSIRGGETVSIGAGDIVHIPAKTPHQVLLEPGAKFTYFVVKIAGSEGR